MAISASICAIDIPFVALRIDCNRIAEITRAILDSLWSDRVGREDLCLDFISRYWKFIR
jgi:hypothetical protein